MFQKTLRGYYFRQHPYVKEWRHYIGEETFDHMYRMTFAFLSKLLPGQYFYVKNLCKRNPDNHFLFLIMIDIYYNMDFFVNLTYDRETDKVTILEPNLTKGMKQPYHPRDMYTEIIKNPELWGVNPDDIFYDSQNPL